MVQTKILSIVCQYNGTCVPCSVCELNACLLNSLSLVLARCPPLTRVWFEPCVIVSKHVHGIPHGILKSDMHSSFNISRICV